MRPVFLLFAVTVFSHLCDAQGRTTKTNEAHASTVVPSHEALLAQMSQTATAAKGRVGVAVAVLGTEEVLAIAADERFPMQSVFKLPLAMTVLEAVDRRVLQLDQQVRVTPADFVSERQHSPIRDNNPEGVTLPISDLLRGAAAESDGTAADVLLGLVGGPHAVTAYIRSLGIRDLNVSKTEKEMGRDAKVALQNWATPKGAIAVLHALEEGRGLSAASREFLLRLLTETRTGPNRIKGLLPTGTAVAHKTGSSGTIDGITAATNDIGIITLPDGKSLAIAVFVSDSPANDATRERVIANIARAAYDFATQAR